MDVNNFIFDTSLIISAEGLLSKYYSEWSCCYALFILELIGIPVNS